VCHTLVSGGSERALAVFREADASWMVGRGLGRPAGAEESPHGSRGDLEVDIDRGLGRAEGFGDTLGLTSGSR
jgi:hypothetical protein